LSFFLKKGYLLSIISFLSIIGTWTFKSVCKDTFEQSYNDAALLQTSELDGWKVDDEMPYMERERYRKWIVDCHKASYVPVCVIAEDDYLTSEPNGADSYESRDQSSNSSVKLSGRQRSSTVDSYNSFASLSQKNVQSQRGAIFRRVTGSPMLNFGDTSFILEEGETNGSPTRIFPRQIMKTVSDHDLNEESREKLL
jgi:hypothetical protein